VASEGRKEKNIVDLDHVALESPREGEGREGGRGRPLLISLRYGRLYGKGVKKKKRKGESYSSNRTKREDRNVPARYCFILSAGRLGEGKKKKEADQVTRSGNREADSTSATSQDRRKNGRWRRDLGRGWGGKGNKGVRYLVSTTRCQVQRGGRGEEGKSRLAPDALADLVQKKRKKGRHIRHRYSTRGEGAVNSEKKETDRHRVLLAC